MTFARILRWVFVAGFVVLVTVCNLASLQQRPAAELVIEMRASVPSLAKVYFDTGRGFNEVESAAQIVSGAPDVQRLVFSLPAKTIRAIRFDPLETDGTVWIGDALIQRSRTHALLQRFDLSRMAARNEIASLVSREGGLEVITEGQSTDSRLVLSLDAPLTIRHSAQQIFSGRFFRLNAIWLVAGVLLLLADRWRSRWWPSLSSLLRRVDKTFTAWSQRCAPSTVLPLDRTAFWYYTLCLAVFAIMALAGLHGSSISMFSSVDSHSSVKHHPLLGKPRFIRIDEWNWHTPTILNQVLRRDRFAAESSLLGPNKAALFGNIPTRHWTEWFRPQFWVFHCLPPAAAFACYWQTKGLLLLTGTFSLLLLLTRSSFAAALGALWSLLLGLHPVVLLLAQPVARDGRLVRLGLVLGRLPDSRSKPLAVDPGGIALRALRDRFCTFHLSAAPTPTRYPGPGSHGMVVFDTCRPGLSQRRLVQAQCRYRWLLAFDRSRNGTVLR